MSEENKRLLRTQMLLGEEGIKNLQKSSVMLIGLGAVGGYVLEALARAGIGHLLLVDFDEFEESNINRQILALNSTLGQKKTSVAMARVKDINPDCQVELFNVFVNADTLPELMSHKADFVIDAIDALNPKCCLLEELSKKNVPFISSMGAALKTDPSHIKLGKLSSSRNCPLAKFVRKRLRHRGVDISKICCVYSDEQISLPDTALQPSEEQLSEGRVRHSIGSLPTITAIFGLTIANEVICRLSGYKK